MTGEVQYWPLAIGWTIVLLLTLFGWERQAALAAAGMAIVTYRRTTPGLGSHDTTDLDRRFPTWTRVGLSAYDVGRAVDLLRARPEVAAVELVGGRLHVDLRQTAEVAPLVGLLVGSGVEVEEVNRGQASLEEVFMTLVEEEEAPL